MSEPRVPDWMKLDTGGGVPRYVYRGRNLQIAYFPKRREMGLDAEVRVNGTLDSTEQLRELADLIDSCEEDGDE